MIVDDQARLEDSEGICTVGPFHCHWIRTSDSDLCKVIAVAYKFSHAETVEVTILRSALGRRWMSAFLERVSLAYEKQFGGALMPGWHWVRYTGLQGSKEVPAEWDGHHWSSTSFAGLPLNAVEVLGSIPKRMPAVLPLSEELLGYLLAESNAYGGN